MKLYTFSFKLLLALFLLISLTAKSQVTIGSDNTPVPGSILDLKMSPNNTVNSTKGLGLPRVALEHSQKIDPCLDSNALNPGDEEAHIGLTVYNVTDNVRVGLCPGVYVWDGTQWIRLPEPCDDPVNGLINSPNCYIVKPNGSSVDIPIAKAYLVSENRSDMQALDRSLPVTIELLWQDSQDLIDNVQLVNGDEGIYSQIRVTTKSGTNVGNALVAVRIGADIAWSWHIWITDYDPDSNTNGMTYSHSNGENNYVFMDRNLGAPAVIPTDNNTMGLMYQWGRKDPFTAATTFYSAYFRPLYNLAGSTLDEVDESQGNPPGSGLKHEQVTSGTVSSLENSIKNPMVIYFGEEKYHYDIQNNKISSPFDWFTADDTGTSSDDALWNTAEGKKSPFDPCPAGWRVPPYGKTKSPWVNFEGLGGGWGGNLVSEDSSRNGLNFKANTNTTEPLGFYPYGQPRIQRLIRSGNMGGGTPFTGGGFTAGQINWGYGYYWTATPVKGEVSAMGDYIVNTGMMGTMVEAQSLSRAQGAFVRCVKE